MTRARWLSLCLLAAGCASKPARPVAEPAAEPDCATGSHAVNGRCEPIDPACPPEHTLVAGKGCVSSHATPPPAPPEPPAGRVVIDEDLSFEDIVVGSGKQLGPAGRVRVLYRGTLDDGTQFDKSPAPVSFQIGKAQLIAGWEKGIPGMREGGKRRLFVGPKKGYGTRGAPPRIPSNAHLVFEIDLIEIESPRPDEDDPQPRKRR